jgi:signal peptidase I
LIERRTAVEVAALLGVLLLFFFLGLRFLAVPWIVAGPSMEPVLRSGDGVLVDVWSYRRREPREREVSLFRAPDGTPMVKRVTRPPRGRFPDGEGVWLLGDNAASSRDSREFGAVPAERFRGRVVWRYWPPSRFGPVR